MNDGDAMTCRGRIQALNDDLRRTFDGGSVVITAGISALPVSQRGAVLTAVHVFDRFDGANDPHGEYDFGAITVAGVRVLWKIDCDAGRGILRAPTPSDPRPAFRANAAYGQHAEAWVAPHPARVR